MERVNPEQKTPTQIRRMFDGIAPRYDLLNRVLSAGLDRSWRTRAVRRALSGMKGPLEVLDVCCGTGDLALEFRRHPAVRRVVGADFAGSMVERARRKSAADPGTGWLVADALKLPMRDHSFDLVSVAFGLRNLVDPEAGIREFGRLLRPGGRLLVLEFLRLPRGAAGAILRAYIHHVLPRVGRWVSGYSGQDAYRYLPASIDGFASAPEVAAWCRGAGLRPLDLEAWTLGTVAIVVAKAATPAGETPAEPGSRAPGTTASTDGLAHTLNPLEFHPCP